MTSSRHQHKRASQQSDRTLRVAEHRSYANLASSFDVPTVGHVTVSKKKQLRFTKSFHGDISDIGGHSTQDGSKAQVLNGTHSSTLPNGYTLLRQHQSSPYRKTFDRHKSKPLRPLNMSKNQNNSNKICELGQEYSSSFLPDSGTGTFRLTHDVSFDEGSRYKSSNNSAHIIYKAGEVVKEVSRRKKSSSSTNEEKNKSSHHNPRFELLNDQSNCRPPTSHIQTLTFKDPGNVFLRLDEKRHAMRGLSPHGGVGSPTFVRTASPNLITALRANRDPLKTWNNKFGDLSISGGGFYGSNPVQSGSKTENSNGVNPLPVNPASNYSPKVSFRALSRDKVVAPSSRPRHSSKGRLDPSSSYGSSTKDPIYSDPCIGAPPSFQQRLNELSLLEAETIKYEKSRKFKRKPKPDKDS